MNLSINKCTVVVVIVIVTHHMMRNNDAILKVGPFFGLLFVAEQSSPYFIRMYLRAVFLLRGGMWVRLI